MSFSHSKDVVFATAFFSPQNRYLNVESVPKTNSFVVFVVVAVFSFPFFSFLLFVCLFVCFLIYISNFFLIFL